MKRNIIIEIVLFVFLMVNTSFSDNNTISISNQNMVVNTSKLIPDNTKYKRVNLSNSEKVTVVFLGAILVAAIALFLQEQ